MFTTSFALQDGSKTESRMLLAVPCCARITTSGVRALAQVSLALKYLDVRPVQLAIDLSGESARWAHAMKSHRHASATEDR